MKKINLQSEVFLRLVIRLRDLYLCGILFFIRECMYILGLLYNIVPGTFMSAIVRKTWKLVIDNKKNIDR